MSLILIPQISGSVLPANVHRRVVCKKPQRSDSTARTPTSIVPARLSTASISSAHRAQDVRPFPLDRLGVEQRAPRLRRFKLS